MEMFVKISTPPLLQPPSWREIILRAPSPRIFCLQRGYSDFHLYSLSAVHSYDLYHIHIII